MSGDNLFVRRTEETYCLSERNKYPSVYQAIGGYEAIPMQVIDDMSLGTSVVDKGYKQGYGVSGKGFITVKWYDNLFAMLKGLEKNQFAVAKYSVFGILLLWLYALIVGVYPFVGLFEV